MKIVSLSHHAKKRMNQRGISRECAEAIYSFARCVRRRGADIYFMDRQSLWLARGELEGRTFGRFEKSFNSYLVVADDGNVITCARRRGRIKH